MRALVAGALLAALTVAGGISPARAASINYGTFVGTTVQYVDVTEDSTTDATPLYLAPTSSGDSLDFNPIFASSSSGAGGSDETDGVLTMMIEALGANVIEKVMITEAGDFSLSGFSGGTGTSASVTAGVTVTIEAVDGSAITPFDVLTSLVFAPSDGDWDLLNDGPGPDVSGVWTGTGMVDLTQALIDEGQPFSFGVTKVSFKMDNMLDTASETGTSADIAKKDIDGLSLTVLPEPAPLALLLLLAPLLPLRRSVGQA
jgi:hypothetical protein